MAANVEEREGRGARGFDEPRAAAAPAWTRAGPRPGPQPRPEPFASPSPSSMRVLCVLRLTRGHGQGAYIVPRQDFILSVMHLFALFHALMSSSPYSTALVSHVCSDLKPDPWMQCTAGRKVCRHSHLHTSSRIGTHRHASPFDSSAPPLPTAMGYRHGHRRMAHDDADADADNSGLNIRVRERHPYPLLAHTVRRAGRRCGVARPHEDLSDGDHELHHRLQLKVEGRKRGRGALAGKIID